MSTIIIVLAVLVAILLVLVVLVQNSKGGGLAAGSSANQVMGVKQTTEFLEKLTWGFAGTLVVLAVVSRMFYGEATVINESELKEKAANTPTASAPAPVSTAKPVSPSPAK
jgi:preprotein translocase subunit SecG